MFVDSTFLHCCSRIAYFALDCFFNFNKIRRAWSEQNKMVRHFHLKLKTQRKVKTLICGPLVWGQVADGAVQQVPRSQSLKLDYRNGNMYLIEIFFLLISNIFVDVNLNIEQQLIESWQDLNAKTNKFTN